MFQPFSRLTEEGSALCQCIVSVSIPVSDLINKASSRGQMPRSRGAKEEIATLIFLTSSDPVSGGQIIS